MTRQIDITVTRGCTLKSGKIFSVEETLPVGITYAELVLGITNGTYTKKSLAGKSYSGQIRERANAKHYGDLEFTVVDDELQFSLDASVTALWENEATTLFYDVFETDIASGEILPIIKGKILVEPAITLGIV